MARSPLLEPMWQRSLDGPVVILVFIRLCNVLVEGLNPAYIACLLVSFFPLSTVISISTGFWLNVKFICDHGACISCTKNTPQTFHTIDQTPTHSLLQVIEGNIIVYMLYHLHLMFPTLFPLLQWLPKLAVAVGTCLAVGTFWHCRTYSLLCPRYVNKYMSCR